MAHTAAPSFFQNPALDRESNLHLIFQPSKTVKRCGLDLRIYGMSLPLQSASRSVGSHYGVCVCVCVCVCVAYLTHQLAAPVLSVAMFRNSATAYSEDEACGMKSLICFVEHV